jgi:UDP-2-acetamido-3-amino-2,3-dideoxy-glucuronate N-acetyltransferase
MANYNIHPLADVQTTNIGINTFIWQFCVVLKNASIGDNCNINCNVFIENDVHIGDNVTVKPGVYLWDGIQIDNNVFVGPNVTFTNDKYPKSKVYPEDFQKTKIYEYSSIGAGSIILGGVEIGPYALVAAGALVTKNVPAHAIVMGSPAKVVGFINRDGSKMKNVDNKFISVTGETFFI